MIIVSDLDGVIFNFNAAYAELLIKEEGTLLPPDWKNYPMFPAPCWDWDTYYGYSKPAQNRVWKAITRRGSTFWQDLKPLPGATEAVVHLNKLSTGNHQVVFLTHRMGYNAKYQTEKALYGLGMNYPTVIMAEDKAPLLRCLGANVFIDDKSSTIWSVAAENIAGLQTFIQDAPYNQDCTILGIERVSGVREMLEKLGL